MNLRTQWHSSLHSTTTVQYTFPDNIFPWHFLTLPWLLLKSLTFPGFPYKWLPWKKLLLLSTWWQVMQTLLTANCRVLPPGQCNSMIDSQCWVYSVGFRTSAAISNMNLHNKTNAITRDTSYLTQMLGRILRSHQTEYAAYRSLSSMPTGRLVDCSNINLQST